MSETPNTDLLLSHRDARGVHTLTLNAPRSFNVLSEAMMAALKAQEVVSGGEGASSDAAPAAPAKSPAE